MADATVELLRRNLFEVFNERDATRRAAAIAALYIENPVSVDPHGEAHSREELSAAIGRLHERFPQAVFSVIGEPDAHHDVGRIAWGQGAPGSPPMTTGLDVVVVENGRIAKLYTFLDPAK